MPNPGQSDLHINVALTNVSIAYMQAADAYIAAKVFPVVKVDKQSNVYWKFSKSDWRRTDVAKRAPGTESAGTGYKMDTDNYFCEVYSVHKDIDDQTRANADSPFNLDREATELVTTQHLLSKDESWAARYMAVGVWATDIAGVSGTPSTGQIKQWDQPDSDPITDVGTLLIGFRQLTGFAFNICVMGAYVMLALKNHPDIIDRIKYTQRGIVTEDLIATVFDVDELYVTYATINDGPEIDDAKAQDAAADYEFIGDAYSVLFCYAPSSPGLMTPSAGYTFVWTGLIGSAGSGIRIKNFRMEHIESNRIEGSTTYDQKVVCKDMGLFIHQAVGT